MRAASDKTLTAEAFEEAFWPAALIMGTTYGLWFLYQFIQALRARYDFIPICPHGPC